MPGPPARRAPAFIQPNEPVQHALIDSFNGKFRDGCLKLLMLQEARLLIEASGRECNEDGRTTPSVM
jgi:hypothetical protein